MSKLEITDIQLFDHTQRHQINEAGDTEIVYDYSANVIINDSFFCIILHVKQMLSGLDYLHAHNVIHRDLTRHVPDFKLIQG